MSEQKSTFEPEEIFQYQKVKNYRIKKFDKWGLNTYLIEFESALKTSFPENNRVFALWHRKNSNKVIVLIHGWHGPKCTYPCYFTVQFRKEGYDTVQIVLPYHRERTPSGYRSGELFFTVNERQNYEAYRQAIIDLMSLADFFQKEGFKIACFGISLGAIILNTLMGVDLRYSAGISFLGAGHIHRIVWEGFAGRAIRRWLKKRGIGKKDYLYILSDYKKYLDKVYRDKKVHETRWSWYYIDPLTYAYRNNPRNVLMVNAFFDEVIPRKAVYETWEAFGYPPLCWIPAGHLTARFFNTKVLQLSLSFLKLRWR